MKSSLSFLASAGHAQALASRPSIADLAFELRRSVSPDFASLSEYCADVARRTVCLTLLAGSGSRWVKSLAAASQSSGPLAEAARAFDSARPRGLFPVRDVIHGKGRLPIASYALAAVDGLGAHLLVVRGWEAEIDAEILEALGIGRENRRFFTQDAPFGKPLGHGDAAWQCREYWKGADYVVTNFGGDANSRRTILSSLLALDALRASGQAVELLIPATQLDAPAYPIRLDEEGLPRSFGHAKLQGQAQTAASGYTNVGLRLYSAPALLREVEDFRARFWIPGSGYAIPGNDPEGHEFALDNVDGKLASEGSARILAIARPEELTPAKSLEDIPAFETAIASVVSEDAALRA